jgi:hypothetical protein
MPNTDHVKHLCHFGAMKGLTYDTCGKKGWLIARDWDLHLRLSDSQYDRWLGDP